MNQSYVDKQHFLLKMKTKWDSYGLKANDSLKQAWLTYCETLNKHASNECPELWSIFPLPTGTGKTQGLISYCAIVSETLVEQGVLIVTRFTDDADKIAESINKETGQCVARAQHSKLSKEDKLSAEQQQSVQVLIITHTAYKKSLSLSLDNATTKQHYKWKHGARLVVIDETLNIDEPLTVDLDELRIARGAIPWNIENQFPHEIRYIDSLIKRFIELANNGKELKYIYGGTWRRSSETGQILRPKEIKPLIDAMRSLKSIRSINSFGKEIIKLSSTYICDLFKALVDITELEGFYFRENDTYKIQAFTLLMPSEVPSAVILDATANYNEIYKLLGNSVEIVDVPNDIRNYSNVTLQVVYGVNVGKDSINKVDNKFIAGLYQSYRGKSPILDTLFCVHKKNRNTLIKSIDGLNALEATNLSHWGNIDGKNDWSALKNIFIYGLPYLGQKNAEGVTLSYQRWIESHEYKYHPDLVVECEHTGAVGAIEFPLDLWQNVEQGHLNVSVIQAINRVRCRQSIDSTGNCEPVSVTLFLNKKDGSQRKYQACLLDSISDAMPNIRIIEVEENVSKNEVHLKGKALQFYKLLSSLNCGEHLAKEIMQQANKKGIGERTVKRYQSQLKNGADTLLVNKLSELGVNYISEHGRKANSRYMKK